MVRAVSTAALPAVLTVCAAAVTPAVAAPAPAPQGVRAPGPEAADVEVSPRRVRAGAELRVRADFCGRKREALASSVAFDTDVALRRTSDGTSFHGTARISAHTPPGSYGLTVVCGRHAQDGQGSFRVIATDRGAYGDRGSGSHAGRDGRHEPPPRHPSPVAPVRAGGGGTAAASTGAEPAHHAGLVTAGSAAVAGAAIWVTRRLRSGTRAG